MTSERYERIKGFLKKESWNGHGHWSLSFTKDQQWIVWAHRTKGVKLEVGRLPAEPDFKRVLDILGMALADKPHRLSIEAVSDLLRLLQHLVICVEVTRGKEAKRASWREGFEARSS